jgi:hypothetical protein
VDGLVGVPGNTNHDQVGVGSSYFRPGRLLKSQPKTINLPKGGYPEYFTRSLGKVTNLEFFIVIPRIFANYKVLPTHAEHALAPVLPSSCGIGSIINSLLGY